MFRHFLVKVTFIIVINITIGLIINEYVTLKNKNLSSHQTRNHTAATLTKIGDSDNILQNNCICPNACMNNILDRIIIGDNNITCLKHIQSFMNSTIISDHDTCIQLLQNNESLSHYDQKCSNAVISSSVKCNQTVTHCNNDIVHTKQYKSYKPKTKKQKTQTIDLVIKLNGELGNHLHKIATAKSIEFLAQEFNYPLKFKLHYLGQRHPKAKTPAKEIPSCFPSFHGANFKECNVPSYDKIVTLQENFYGNLSNTLSIKRYLTGHWRNPDKDSVIGIQEIFDFILNSINNENTIPFDQLQTILNDDDILPLNIPFIQVDSFCMPHFLDRYYEQIKEFFTFNYTSSFCCNSKPDADETVVHIRGFVTEMPRVGKQGRYKELSPEGVAKDLLSHLTAGDKVVLVSRYPKTLEPYVMELEKRGLIVRTISGQTGIQDFCFLMSTTKELIGMYQSTYAWWAAYLSSTVRKVVLYRTTKNTEFVPKYNLSKLATFQFPVY